jgi:hypothetical protein
MTNPGTDPGATGDTGELSAGEVTFNKLINDIHVSSDYCDVHANDEPEEGEADRRELIASFNGLVEGLLAKYADNVRVAKCNRKDKRCLSFVAQYGQDSFHVRASESNGVYSLWASNGSGENAPNDPDNDPNKTDVLLKGIDDPLAMQVYGKGAPYKHQYIDGDFGELTGDAILNFQNLVNGANSITVDQYAHLSPTDILRQHSYD